LKAVLCRTSTKAVTQCILYYYIIILKITSNLLFEYQCTSGKFIRLPNRIESETFFPELECFTVCVCVCVCVQIFRGNSNTYIAEVREISPAIIARRLRVVPHSTYPRTVCMRVELYGCMWRGDLCQPVFILLTLTWRGIPFPSFPSPLSSLHPLRSSPPFLPFPYK